MKTLAIATMLFIAVTASFAQTTVTIESNLDGGKSIDLYARDGSTFAYACISEGWGELYAGKVYSLAPWVELSAGIGFETGQDSPRFGGSVWAGQGRHSFLYLWEKGGSGPWHKMIVAYQVSDKLKAGLIDRSHFGQGITAEYKLGNCTKLTGALYEGGKSTVALSCTF